MISPEQIEWIGSIAGLLTTLAYAPQVYKSLVSRSLNDVSLLMYSVMVLGIALWLAYGLLIWSVPLIAANTVTLVLAGAILLLKVRHALST